MTKHIPPDDGNARPASSPAGMATAGEVGSNTDHSGRQPEVDQDDDDWSPVPGRSWDEDVRIAIHEAGHAVAARLLGRQVGGVTVNPDTDRGFEGLCWGVGYKEAFNQGRGDASDVREALAPLMPEPGEDRRAVSDIFGHVRDQCIEFLAGRAAERILLEGEPAPPVDDLRQARELARLICSSEEAIETFIAHCDVAARDLLMPYGDVVMALSIVLRIKRTMNGAEIDELIADVQARKARAIELARRADWKRRELSARAFPAEIKSRE
jgi:hypothetical protein